MFLDSEILKRCLVIDIETVSEFPNYDELTAAKKALWDIKALQISKYVQLGEKTYDSAELYAEKAGIFAEFAKVACISVGFFSQIDAHRCSFKIKSFVDEQESLILAQFSELLSKYYVDYEVCKIAGHNIKEFDIPFLCRRLIVNHMSLPSILDISGKKPWQTTHLLDTLDLWRFGDFKNYTSLNLLAATLDIDTPKDDIDGSMVGSVYWNDKDLGRIATYCQKDIVTVAQILLRFTGMNALKTDDVIVVT